MLICQIVKIRPAVRGFPVINVRTFITLCAPMTKGVYLWFYGNIDLDNQLFVHTLRLHHNKHFIRVYGNSVQNE